jgi:hypothetical protein
MDNDQKFWVSVWGLVAVILIVLMSLAFANGQANNKTVIELVKLGADPVAATCAVNGIGQTNIAVCTALGVKGVK